MFLEGEEKVYLSLHSTGRCHISRILRKWQPLQYSCLESPVDRGAWWAIVRGVVKSWTQLSEHTRKLSHKNK